MTAGDLAILYCDEWLVAIHKPAGLLVHRSALDKHAHEFAVQQLRDQLGRHVYPIHRLDRPTSGILLFAFEPKIVRQMQQNWVAKTKKRYQALIRGWLNGAGVIDYALRYEADKIAEKNKRQDRFQPAITYYQALDKFEVFQPVGRYQSARYSLIDLWPQTGRKHQLRRHLAHIRHPIVADTTHGDGKQNRFMRDNFGCNTLALSCVELQFLHPATESVVMISSPRSDNFNHCIAQLNQLKK